MVEHLNFNHTSGLEKKNGLLHWSLHSRQKKKKFVCFILGPHLKNCISLLLFFNTQSANKSLNC